MKITLFNKINILQLLLLFSLSAESQFIFTIADLESFCSTSKGESPHDMENYFKDYGYFSDKLYSDINIFSDKYGNSITTIDEGKSSHSVSYHVNLPNANSIFEYEKELKNNYQNYVYEKEKYYYSTGACIIIIEQNAKYYSIMVIDNRDAHYSDLLSPIIKGTNLLEVTSYTRGVNLKVKKGDKVYIKATGNIILGSWAGSSSPDGIEGFQNYSEVADLKHGSLIANIGIGKDGWFYIGSYKVFTAEKSGNLRLMVNDADPSNNSGSFIVEYGINKEIKPPLVPSEQPKVEEKQNKLIENKETVIPNNPSTVIQKPIIDNSPKLILEDFFVDNKNNWAVASDKHSISIENNRMLYENKEKSDKVYTMAGIPISLKGNDNYTVEVSIQSLTPCQSQQLDNLISLVAQKPVFYGFAIGDQQNDILFAVGSNLDVREGRDNTTYTCRPSYFITSLVGGNSSYLQNWTKSSYVFDGGNVNILKLVKKDGTFSFYINNRLLSSKNAYSLSNDNAISIVTSAKSKISVNYVKIYKD